MRYPLPPIFIGAGCSPSANGIGNMFLIRPRKNLMQNTNLFSAERDFHCKMQQTLLSALLQQLFFTFGYDRRAQQGNTQL